MFARGLSRQRVVTRNEESVDAKIWWRATALERASSPPADIGHLDVDRHLAAVPLHRQRHPLSHSDALEFLDQIGQPAYRLAVHTNDDIPWLSRARVHAAQPRALGGRARGGSDNDDALRSCARGRRFAGGNNADTRR